MRSMTLADLDARKAEGRRFAMVTAYDSGFSALMGSAGIACILVGDSLGMVVQGASSTVAVSLDDMVYHTRCVARGVETGEGPRPVIVADLPIGSYFTPEAAALSAARLVAAGANVVKLEGGAWLGETVRFLSERGLPVCAHLGLTPQSVDMLGGYKVQGKSDAQARRIENDAALLEEAGARLVLLECVPDSLGAAITRATRAPVIGIGAGPATDGQVLVLHDMLGVSRGRKARFVKDFLSEAGAVDGALRAFAQAVESGAYPAPEHCYG